MAYSIPERAYRAKSRSDLPKNAVVMTDVEVINYNSKRIENWEPRHEMWPFSYGSKILGFSTVITASLIDFHFRRKFFLGSVGHVTTFAPTVLLPLAATIIFHRIVIQEKVVSGEISCPVCTEIHAASLHTLMGVVYPTAISAIATVMLARKYKTCYVPLITETRGIFKMVQHVSPRMSLFILLVANFGLGMFVTGSQMNSFTKIHERDCKEREMESDGFE